MESWIKLYRKFSQWEWYKIPEMVHLFIHLLINANSKDGSWRGVQIKRGQMVTGLHSLSEDTGISIRKIRTCLSRLNKTKEIDIQTTNKFSIITIINYDSYQDKKDKCDKQNDKQTTSNRQAIDNKQEYKNIEDNNNYKEKTAQESLEERREIFMAEISKFRGTFPDQMLQNFFNYWGEADRSFRQMKYEKQKTWELKRRLQTWFNNDNKFKNNGRQQGAAASELAELLASRFGSDRQQ